MTKGKVYFIQAVLLALMVLALLMFAPQPTISVQELIDAGDYYSFDKAFSIYNLCKLLVSVFACYFSVITVIKFIQLHHAVTNSQTAVADAIEQRNRRKLETLTVTSK